MDLYRPYSVDLATLVPGVSRAAGARTVTFTSSDFGQAYHLIQRLVQLVSIKASQLAESAIDAAPDPS